MSLVKCKKCGNNFENKPIIDGVQRSLGKRKYCFDCSPFNKHNTSQLNILNTERICEVCHCVYIYNREKGEKFLHLCKKCYSKQYYTSGRGSKSFKISVRKRRKIQIVDYLGSKCEICGYNKCVEALDVHHINPEEKEFTISGNHSRSWEAVQKELDKCTLLCANCHREFHAGLINLPPIV